MPKLFLLWKKEIDKQIILNRFFFSLEILNTKINNKKNGNEETTLKAFFE